MKEIYIDIMEKAFDAYGIACVRNLYERVKSEGLKEHGFCRLTADLGLLISFGRKTSLLPLFIEMMDLSTSEILLHNDTGNDFSVKELCFAIMRLRDNSITDASLLNRWISRLKAFEPTKNYTAVAKTPNDSVANWAAFNAASEYMRSVLCGVDSSAFIDMQIATQLKRLDENGMYLDPDCPIMYDVTPRCQLAILLHFGYNGKFRREIDDCLQRTAVLTLKMQSVSGEMPFGGRSNQMIMNEAMLASFYEYAAVRYKKDGDIAAASKYKAAAVLAKESMQFWLTQSPVSHVKNRYDIDSSLGCENYAYYDKYMITLASFAYVAYLFSDDSIPCCAEKPAPYVCELSKDFHKVFVKAGGYFLEFDTNADSHYDSSGLGRIHAAGCFPPLCLSVPFSGKPMYGIEGENPGPMSVCSFLETKDGCRYGARDARYSLKDRWTGEQEAGAEFLLEYGGGLTATERYSVNSNGVTAELQSDAAGGFFLPVFSFDGSCRSVITEEKNRITVCCSGSTCTYLFAGSYSAEPSFYYNRNGRYKIFRIYAKKVKIAMHSENGAP